jgi:hypothetical protein
VGSTWAAVGSRLVAAGSMGCQLLQTLMQTPTLMRARIDQHSACLQAESGNVFKWSGAIDGDQQVTLGSGVRSSASSVLPMLPAAAVLRIAQNSRTCCHSPFAPRSNLDAFANPESARIARTAATHALDVLIVAARERHFQARVPE